MNKTHLKLKCPDCGSDNLREIVNYDKSGDPFDSYICDDCGAF